MKHTRNLSRLPQMAETIAPEVKLTFAIDVIEAAIPLFTNKNPQNPAPSV